MKGGKDNSKPDAGYSILVKTMRGVRGERLREAWNIREA